jgi:hypothetical protein
MGEGDQVRGHQDELTAYFTTVDLTRDEIWFLKALRAAGERGRIVSAQAARVGLARLVELRYIAKHAQSERKTLYIITDRGWHALTNAPQ